MSAAGDFAHVPPRDHPLWPAFERWVEANAPAAHVRVMYWAAFQAGAKAGLAAAAREAQKPADYWAPGPPPAPTEVR